MAKQIDIYDTTLRDGAQMRGISFGVHDKLRILQLLDNFGVAYVEGGWPGANPKDVDFFEEAKKLKLNNSKLTAFGSTRKVSTTVEEDPILAALLRAETEVVCIVSKSSKWQVEKTLNTTPENNLVMLKESVEYLKAQGRRVFVDAEHFFDGYNSSPEYSEAFVQAAVEAGAEYMVLCDTNGGSLPEDVYDITQHFVQKYPGIKFGIHAHNDSDMAVANSVRAVRAGATQVQGTINGYGERCGNANLISVIANLQLKYKQDQMLCVPPGNLTQLTHISKTVAEIANMNHNRYQPFTGASAFTHKGGLHASALQKEKTSYEHINPHLVGNITRIIVSDQSGISNMVDWIRNRGLDLLEGHEVTDREAEEKTIVKKLLAKIKDREHQGYSYENASASLELLARKVAAEHFISEQTDLNFFETVGSFTEVINGDETLAKVTIKVGDQELECESSGNGPANALDQALRKALRNFYPQIDNFQLQDFKVRIKDSHLGTGAVTIVQITTGDKRESWNTIGVSTNIIKAAWDAIVDSTVYGLKQQGVQSK